MWVVLVAWDQWLKDHEKIVKSEEKKTIYNFIQILITPMDIHKDDVVKSHSEGVTFGNWKIIINVMWCQTKVEKYARNLYSFQRDY